MTSSGPQTDNIKELQLTDNSRAWLFQIRGYLQAAKNHSDKASLAELQRMYDNFWLTLKWELPPQ